MRGIVRIAAVAFACAAVAASGMTRIEYKAARSRIAAAYEADRQRCGAHLGHATQLCVVKARGARKVTGAELEAAYKPGPRTNHDAAIARAQAAYAAAKKECDNQNADTRKACAKDASAARDRAKAEAAAARKAAIADAAAAPKPAGTPR